MPQPALNSGFHQWQRAVARIFAKPSVEFTIGGLIGLSVILTLLEFALSTGADVAAQGPLGTIEWLNQLLTWFFVAELVLRLLALGSPRRFLREYWIDVVAVVPSVMPQLYTARLLRLIRLLRILRVFGYASRLTSNFPYILRRGAFEYVTVCGLLLFTVLISTGCMLLFERERTPGEAFWFSVYSLFAGEPIPDAPATVGGRLVAVFVMFMGLTIFAMFTGTVSAFMVERLRMEGRSMDWDQLRDHVVVCGWNTKVEIILNEYRVSRNWSDVLVVVIGQWEHEQPLLAPELKTRVRFLEGDFTRVPVLEKAGIHRARNCLILADTSGGRTEQDADARTILTALTVEKLNPSVYTCAELHNSQYASHLKIGHVNDYVVGSELSAFLLAQSAMNRGLMGVFSELLTYKRGNQFYRIPLPSSWHGRSFAELYQEAKQAHNAILVAVHSANGEACVNPSQYTFAEGDEIVVIAEREVEL